MLLIYFEKYLEGQKNKINYITVYKKSSFLDGIIKEIKNGNVKIDLFRIVSEIYDEKLKNDIFKSQNEIIKKFDLDYFKKYFEIQNEFRENITFDELNGFKKWFVLYDLQVILKNYKSFLYNLEIWQIYNLKIWQIYNLEISQNNWEFYIPRILKCKELLDQQPDFLRLLPIIGNLYEYYLNEEEEKGDIIKKDLERIKLLQDFYPEILKEINPNEIKIKDFDLNEQIEDLLSSHFGNFAAEKILGFVKEFNEKDKENKLLNANKIFLEKKIKGRYIQSFQYKRRKNRRNY